MNALITPRRAAEFRQKHAPAIRFRLWVTATECRPMARAGARHEFWSVALKGTLGVRYRNDGDWAS